MTPARLATPGGVISIGLATPPAVALQQEVDSVVVHWIDAGGPLLQLLSGLASVVKGAFVPEEAERIHGEAWDPSAAARYSSHQQQVERSYSYLAGVREDRQGILGISLLTTHPRRFDVRFTSTAEIIKGMLNLHGVGSTPGSCPAEVGPATMARELRLNHRDHTVYISHGKTTCCSGPIRPR